MALIKDSICGKGIYGLSKYGLIFTDKRDHLFSFEARKKVSAAAPGFVGIYHTMPTSKGRITRRLKLYSPRNPQSEAQQANRAKITAAVLSWKNLTNEQKEVYNIRAEGKPFSGYNLFIKEYLLSS
jgi:hypothetical protein